MEKNEFELLNTWLDKVKYCFTHDNNAGEIPAEELISLKELATLIQIAYSRFKEDYKTLEKLNIGQNNNVLDFHDDIDGRFLYMMINEQEKETIVPNGFHYMEINDFNEEPELSFKNSEMVNRKSITINNVDSRILKGYLDLFQEHSPIFKLYVDSQENNCLTSNISQYLMMNMDTNNDSLINGLNGIEFNIQNFNEMGNNFVIRLYVDLRNGVNIDYNKSKIIVNDSIKTGNDFDVLEIINCAYENIKLNRSSLEDSRFIEYAEIQKKIKEGRIFHVKPTSARELFRSILACQANERKQEVGIINDEGLRVDPVPEVKELKLKWEPSGLYNPNKWRK